MLKRKRNPLGRGKSKKPPPEATEIPISEEPEEAAPPPEPPKPKRKHYWVQVQDGMMGFYGLMRRREGDVFLLMCRACLQGPPNGPNCTCDSAEVDRQFSERWMRDVPAPADEQEIVTTATTEMRRRQKEIYGDQQAQLDVL